MSFLDVWIAYAVCGVTLFSAIFVWAVREGQFFDIDRARFIALKDAKNTEDKAKEQRPSNADRFLLYTIFAVTLVVLAALFWVGLQRQ